MLIEIADPDDRDLLLAKWRDLPKHIYVKLESGNKVYARFDPRQVGNARLSSVQYLKFDTKGAVPAAIGTDLPELSDEVSLNDIQREALGQGLNE